MLALFFAAAASVATPKGPSMAGGLGEWHYGMTKEDVRATTSCSPWKDVPTTGGLECPNFELAGKKRNVSFLFGPDGGLVKIQVWFCESADRKTAAAALDEVLDFATKTWGELDSSSLPAKKKVTRDALLDAVDAAAGKGTPKAQFKPLKQPDDAFIFASLFHDPTYGYYCFLYFTAPTRAA
jgi:hypothetical protein